VLGFQTYATTATTPGQTENRDNDPAPVASGGTRSLRLGRNRDWEAYGVLSEFASRAHGLHQIRPYIVEHPEGFSWIHQSPLTRRAPFQTYRASPHNPPSPRRCGPARRHMVHTRFRPAFPSPRAVRIQDGIITHRPPNSRRIYNVQDSPTALGLNNLAVIEGASLNLL